MGKNSILSIAGAAVVGLADAQVEGRLRKVGMDGRASSPDEMRAMVGAQIAKWKQVVADAKIPQQ